MAQKKEAPKRERAPDEGPEPGPIPGSKEFNEKVERGEAIRAPDPTGPSPRVSVEGQTPPTRATTPAEDEDLHDKTVDQLREIADEEGADLTGITLKDDIIKAIEKNRK